MWNILLSVTGFGLAYIFYIDHRKIEKKARELEIELNRIIKCLKNPYK